MGAILPPGAKRGEPTGAEVLFERDDPFEGPFTMPFITMVCATAVFSIGLSFWIRDLSLAGRAILFGTASLLLIIAVLAGADRSRPLVPAALTADAVWAPPPRPVWRRRERAELRFDKFAEVVLSREGKRTWVYFRHVAGSSRGQAVAAFHDPGDQVRPLVLQAARKHGARVKQALRSGEQPLRLTTDD